MQGISRHIAPISDSKKNKIPSFAGIKRLIIQAKNNFDNRHFYTDFALSSNAVRYNINMYEKLVAT